jgi:dTDP-4-dehydrorhamnose 3,5-epimerase
MIEGVKIKQIKRHCDDRGFFSEIIKFGEETFAQVKQTSYSQTYPGVIKAFHWHKKQTDIWFFASGMAQVVLYDLREDSSTYQETNVFYMGEANPLLLLIPPGVAHGYRVLGSQPAGLFYHTTEPYNPENPDEERIPFDDPKIGFDWQTKNR